MAGTTVAVALETLLTHRRSMMIKYLCACYTCVWMYSCNWACIVAMRCHVIIVGQSCVHGLSGNGGGEGC